MLATDVEIAQGVTVWDGVLNVHKACGWTSHDVVARLREIVGARKIGHAGTLDPAATGVLPVLIGKGTRIAEYLVDWEKEYRAVMRLGETTDTQDATGAVLSRCSAEGLREGEIRDVALQFQGTLNQLPPMYSAVKVGGVPLYKAARAGRTVERRLREVTVHEIEVLETSGRDVSLRVVCSKGTYIRTLCADIGQRLGVGGHLLSLQRSRVGPLGIQDALTLDQIQSQFHLGVLGDSIMPLDQALESFPALRISDAAAARARHGVPVPVQEVEDYEGSARPAELAGHIARVKTREGLLVALVRVPTILAQSSVQGEPASHPLSIVKVLVTH